LFIFTFSTILKYQYDVSFSSLVLYFYRCDFIHSTVQNRLVRPTEKTLSSSNAWFVPLYALSSDELSADAMLQLKFKKIIGVILLKILTIILWMVFEEGLSTNKHFNFYLENKKEKCLCSARRCFISYTSREEREPLDYLRTIAYRMPNPDWYKIIESKIWIFSIKI
jgi:hypothetical protein